MYIFLDNGHLLRDLLKLHFSTKRSMAKGDQYKPQLGKHEELSLLEWIKSYVLGGANPNILKDFGAFIFRFKQS